MMEGGSGMVAVVRSLRDTGLAVTLLDKGRQYTLCPKNALENNNLQVNSNIAQPCVVPRTTGPEQNNPRMSTGVLTDNVTSGLRRDSAAQAVDDRYASVYQTTHCRLKPTSPTYNVTEFPPQPKQLYPGHGNFVVGGAGSGDSMHKPVKAHQYRGGMVWSDKGSVFAPRASREPDHFASSLRRYPCMSPERSTEIVERMINYTQGKGFSKRSYRSDSKSSNQHLVRSPSPATRRYEDTRNKTRREEKQEEEHKKGILYNEYDVRYLRSEKFPKKYWGNLTCDENPNMVNSKIQADVPTDDRQVSTSPMNNLNSHNAAVLLSPVVSRTSAPQGASSETVPQSSPNKLSEHSVKSETSFILDNEANHGYEEDESQNSQKKTKKLKHFVQYTSTSINPKLKLTKSSVDMIAIETNEYNALRKSRSQTNSTKSSKEEIVEWLRDICKINKTIDMCAQLHRLAENLKKPGAEQRLRDKIEKYLKKIPSYFSEGDKDGMEFRQQLPQNIIRKLKNIYERQFNFSSYDTYRFEVPNFYLRDDISQFKNVIRNWLKPLSIDKELLDTYRHVNKEDIHNFLVYRLEPFVLHKRSNPEYKRLLKAYVLEVVNDLPIKVLGDAMQQEYINEITENLTNNLFKLDSNRSRKNANIKGAKSTFRLKKSYKTFKRYNNAKKVKEFIADQLTKLVQNKVLCVNKRRLICIEMELRDLLLNVIDSKELNIDVNKCIQLLLLHIGKVTKEQSKETSEIISKDFKKLYESITGEKKDFRQKSDNISKFYTESCSIYHCEDDSKVKNQAEENNQKKTNTCDMDAYTQKVESVIKTWLNEIGVSFDQTKKKAAINDLAIDIADRKKYLQINSFKQPSQANEIKNLKYQIFKWLGKVISGNDLEITERASCLIEIINQIPTPVIKPKPKLFSDEGMKVFSEHLYEQIYDWFHDELRSVGDEKSKRMLVQNLVDRITQDKERGDIHRRINVVVDAWNAEVLPGRTKNSITSRLKEKIKRIVDSFIEYEEKEISRADKAEVSIQIESQMYNSATNTEITEELVQEELNRYVNEIEHEILEWLKCIKVVEIYQNPLKEVAIRDLAWDIFERYKYVQINPSSQGSEEELEILKYQVYKCIKKLDKSELKQTLELVNDLLSRIKQIPVPIYSVSKLNHDSITYDFKSPINLTESEVISNESKETTGQLKWQIQANSRAQMAGNILRDPISMNECLATGTSLGTMGAKEFHSSYLSTINEASVSNSSSCYCETPIDGTNNRNNYYVPKNCEEYNASLNIKQDNTFDQANILTSPVCGYTSSSYFNVNSKVTDNFDLKTINKFPTSIPSNFNKNRFELNSQIDNSESEYYLPNNMTVYKTYQYFDRIFKEKCAELPIIADNGEQKSLADLAKQGIYNGIWKTYFKYKSDPEVGHDYVLFENKVDTQLDFMLNCLPQNKELVKIRVEWKQKIVSLNILMLRYVNSLTDLPSFRQLLADKFAKQFMINKPKEDDRYNSLITYVANCFVVYASYRCDIMQSSLYRQRLIDILQELASYVITNVDGYKCLGNEQLCQKAFNILLNIPLPSEEIINYEAKEILMEQEIELWYLELPTKPVANTTDELIRARMKQILAKNLHEIEIKSHNDDYKHNQWHQEILRFLQKDAKLRQDYFKTGFMVETLISRLNNLHRRGHSNYFAQNNQISQNRNVADQVYQASVGKATYFSDTACKSRASLANARIGEVLSKSYRVPIGERSERRVNRFERLKYPTN